MSETTFPQPLNATTPRPSFFHSPLVYLSAMLALLLLAPLVPLPNIATAIIGGITLTFGYVWLVLRFVDAVTRQKLPLPRLIAWFGLCLLGWAMSEFVAKPALQSTLTGFGRDVPTMWQLIGALNFNARSLLLVSAAALFGACLSHIVRHANMIGPLCGIAALVDIWGVLFGGIVSQVLDNPATKPVAAKAMAALPHLGAATSRFSIPLPDVGVGDFLFLGLFWGVLHTHGLNARGALNWVWPLVSVALVLVTMGINALPGLLFIGLGVAIPNRGYCRYTREEKFALAWAAPFVAVLTAVLYFLITSQLQPR